MPNKKEDVKELKEKLEKAEQDIRYLKKRSEDWVFGPIRIGDFGGGGMDC